MSLKDELRKKSDQLVDYAKSEKAREDLRSAARTVADKADQIAESETAKKVVAKGRALVDEVLGHLSDGDSPTQAAAKTAKRHLAKPDDDAPPSPDEPSTSSEDDPDDDPDEPSA